MAREVRSDRARLTPADYVPDWIRRGGPGSGHFGHEGRPGQRGGSAPGEGETSINQAQVRPEANAKWADRLLMGEKRGPRISVQRASEARGWWMSPEAQFYEVSMTHDDTADDLLGGRGNADKAIEELGVRPSAGSDRIYSGDVLLQAFGWLRGGQRERQGGPLMFVDAYRYPTTAQEDAVKALYLLVKPSEFEVQDSSGAGNASRGVRGEAERIFGEMPDLAAVARGGPGSGHFGHEGRPGQRGGSAPGGGDTSISESRPRVRPSDTPPTTDDKVYERIKSAMYQPDSKNYGPRSADQVAKGLQEQGGAWHLWLLPNGEAIRVESHMDSDWAVRWAMKKAVFEDGFERTPIVEAIITSKNEKTNTEAMYRAGAVRISAFARNAGAGVTIGITVGGKEFLQPTDKQAEYVSDLYYRTPAAEWIMELAVGEIAGHAMWLDDFEKNAARAGLRLRAAPAPAFFYIPLLNEDGIAVLAADIGRYLMRYSIEGTAVPQTDLHVTLLYLDAITDGQMKQMLDGLALPLRFKVEVVGMERLGDALVLRLAPDPALLRLQRDLWMAAKRVGAQIGGFSNPSEFKPHITLAYDIPPLLRLDDLPITQDNLNHCETWTVSCDTFAFGRENGEAKRTVALPKTAGDRLFVVQGGPMVWPHISKPQGRIELTHEQWLAVMRGKTVLTSGRRLVTRSMGPFVVKGGPGSGHFGHEGRPGVRGGSLPGEGGTSISEAKEAKAVAINSGVLNATWKGNLESTPDDSLAVADDFNDRGWLIHDEEIKAGAEFWLSPEGHAFGVEQVGGHAEAAGRALFNLYGLKLAEAMKEDAITREVDEGYNSVDRPAWRYSWQGEGGAQTDLGSLIKERDGLYRWEPGVGLVLAETHNLSDAILDHAAQEAMRRTTFDSEAKAVSAIEAVAPYAAVWGMMRANASATSNTETKLAALGFVRISRGGTGAQNTAGISWDASLPPTQAQRDVLSTVVAQAQADPKHNGGIVWETVNQTMATAGIEGVATETDDYESFWSAIEGNYAKAMHARSVSEDLVRRFLIQRGGPGSGHFGHEGRPGQRGGSAPGEGDTSISEGKAAGIGSFQRQWTGTTFSVISSERFRRIEDEKFGALTTSVLNTLKSRMARGNPSEDVLTAISLIDGFANNIEYLAVQSDNLARSIGKEEAEARQVLPTPDEWQLQKALDIDRALAKRYAVLDLLSLISRHSSDVADIPGVADWVAAAKEGMKEYAPLSEEAWRELIVETLAPSEKEGITALGMSREAMFDRYLERLPGPLRSNLSVQMSLALCLSRENTGSSKVLVNITPQHLVRGLTINWMLKSEVGDSLGTAVLDVWRSFAEEGIKDGSTPEARAALLNFATYVMPLSATQTVGLEDTDPQVDMLIDEALERAPTKDVMFYVDQTIAEALPKQWIPPDEAGHEQMADAVNIAWRNIDMNTAKDALQSIAGDLWDLDYQYKGKMAEPEGSDIDAAKLLAESPEEAKVVLQSVYERTQNWFAERGYKPDDEVPLFRGVQSMSESWNPSMRYGTAQVRMWPLSSWTFSPGETLTFTKQGGGALIAARIAVRDIVAIADTGFPCAFEGELVVRGNPVVGQVLEPTLEAGKLYESLLESKALFVVTPDDAGDWIGQALKAKGFANRNDADAVGDSKIVNRGGPGSGHFGHEGRQGQRGGSLPGGGDTSISEARAPGGGVRDSEGNRYRVGNFKATHWRGGIADAQQANKWGGQGALGEAKHIVKTGGDEQNYWSASENKWMAPPQDGSWTLLPREEWDDEDSPMWENTEATALANAASGAGEFLDNYVENSARSWNSWLRTNDGTGERFRTLVAGMDVIMDRSETPSNVVAWRGMDGKWVDRLQAGREFTDHGYSSTTLLSSVVGYRQGTQYAAGGRPYDWTFAVLVPESTRAYYVGRDHGQGGASAKEYELLLDRGTRFKVESIDKDARTGVLRVVSQDRRKVK